MLWGTITVCNDKILYAFLCVEMICWSTLIGCFIGSGHEKNKLSNMRIKFVVDMCRRIQSVDYRRQNILRCFLSIYQICSVFLDKSRVMDWFLL